MTIVNDQVAITTSAGVIVASNANRKKLIIHNVGSDTIYIGDDGSITSSNAFPILSGETFEINDYTGIIKGICASGETSTAAYIEQQVS